MTNEQLEQLRILAERATCLVFTGIQPTSADKNDLAVAVSPDILIHLIDELVSLRSQLEER